MDPAGRTQQELTHRYYKEMGELARDVAFREGVKRLILAGPREITAGFREALPNDLKDRVAAEERVDLSASEGEILDRLEEIRQRAEHEREAGLLAAIRERGVRGPEDTIKALQEENRVYHLAVLWELDGEVRWSDTDGLAIMDITQEKSPFSGEPTRVRPLTDVLVEPRRRPAAPASDFMRGGEREHRRPEGRVRRHSGPHPLLASPHRNLGEAGGLRVRRPPAAGQRHVSLSFRFR
jgi:hypothetical protein